MKKYYMSEKRGPDPSDPPSGSAPGLKKTDCRD